MPSIFVLIADPDSICTGFHAKSKHGPVSELAATMTLTKQPKLFLYLEAADHVVTIAGCVGLGLTTSAYWVVLCGHVFIEESPTYVCL